MINMLVQVLILFCVVSCQSKSMLPELEVTVMPAKFSSTKPYTNQIKMLEEWYQDYPHWKDVTRDLYLTLRGMNQYELLNKPRAIELWQEVVKNYDGRIAKFALDKMVGALRDIMGENGSSNQVANYIWRDLSKGRVVYFDSVGIKSSDDLNLWISKSNLKVSKKKDTAALDRLSLEQLSHLYCRDSSGIMWKDYIEGFKGREQKYWDALVKVCRNDRKSAFPLFSDLIKTNRADKYSYLAAKHIVGIHRYNGDRELAAKAFLQQLNIVKKQEKKWSSWNLHKNRSWDYELVNVMLWAARYQAMIGRYDHAGRLVREAEEHLVNVLKKNQPSSARREFLILKAEAIHIAANRIFFEKGDLVSAAIKNYEGLEFGFNAKWKERFLWFDGWYAYQQGLYQKALDTWRNLEPLVVGKKREESVLFWLAKACRNVGNKEGFKTYWGKVLSKYPLGFYSLYGANKYGWDRGVWLSHLRQGWEKSLLEWDLNIAPIISNDDLNQLRLKAELSLAIDSEELAKIYSRDLFSLVRKSVKLDDNIESHLYITRIMYMAHLYKQSLGHTATISIRYKDLWKDYPEQLLIFYPMAYRSIVSAAANVSGIDKNLIWSLARQESAFDPNATSWVGARGLLQLMPKTASIYDQAKRSEAVLVEELSKPTVNVDIAVKYLQNLSARYKGYAPSMIASYNAGEYVVDRWRKVRNIGDDLHWIENIPFAETKGYVKKVMRNWIIYSWFEPKEVPM